MAEILKLDVISTNNEHDYATSHYANDIFYEDLCQLVFKHIYVKNTSVILEVSLKFKQTKIKKFWCLLSI